MFIGDIGIKLGLDAESTLRVISVMGPIRDKTRPSILSDDSMKLILATCEYRGE